MILQIKEKIKKLLFSYKINRVKIFVWDYDGTLYQSKKLAQALKLAYIQYLNKKSTKLFSEQLFDIENNKYGKWSKTVAILTGEAELKVMDVVENKFNKSSYLKKNKNLIRTIAQLGHKKHYILSNSKVADIKDGLKKIGFQNSDAIFSHILGRDNSKHLKPDQKAFTSIMQLTNCAAKQHLMIGDSLVDDILPAKTAGFKTMHINELNHHWKIHQ